MWYFASFDGNQLHIAVQIFAQNTMMYINQLRQIMDTAGFYSRDNTRNI